MRPEDVYELVTASDPRISPDGSRVAYVVTSTDR
jgi:dipeptidyl aminopeptidase/acylaminoacyl peptidase